MHSKSFVSCRVWWSIFAVESTPWHTYSRCRPVRLHSSNTGHRLMLNVWNEGATCCHTVAKYQTCNFIISSKEKRSSLDKSFRFRAKINKRCCFYWLEKMWSEWLKNKVISIIILIVSAIFVSSWVVSMWITAGCYVHFVHWDCFVFAS